MPAVVSLDHLNKLMLVVFYEIPIRPPISDDSSYGIGVDLDYRVFWNTS